MDDYTYTYVQRQKELKRNVRSARQKVVNKKPGKIMMPSDYLSRAEKRRMNKQVATYEMDKPHDYIVLKEWPKDLQRKYIEHIIGKYRPLSPQLMTQVLHVNQKKFYEFLDSLGIKLKKGPNRTKEQIESWENFINGLEPALEQEPESEPELPKIDLAQNKRAAMAANSVMSFPEKVTIHTKGKPLQILDTIAQFYCDPTCEYDIYMVAEKRAKPEPPEREMEEAAIDSIPEDEF